MKTHWKKTFNKEYLGSHDLEEGQELKVVIKSTEVRTVKDSSGKDGKCNVAIFDGNIKPMILNVTACKQIKKFSGSNYIEDWKNIPIQIFSKKIRAFGEDTEALRIRDVQPNLNKPKLTEKMEAFNKAKEFIQSNPNGINKVKEKYIVTPEIEKLLKS